MSDCICTAGYKMSCPVHGLKPQPNAKFSDLMIGDEFELKGRTFMKMSYNGWARYMDGLYRGQYEAVANDTPVYCSRPQFVEKQDALFHNPEQDARTARSARMIQPYSEEEIELLMQQPPTRPE